MPDLGRGPAALHLARRGPGLGQRLADRPPAGRVGHGDQGVGRGLVVGEPAVAERDVGSDPLWRSSLDRAPARLRPRGHGARRGDRRRAARRCAAPMRRGSCASRCSGTGGPAGPARRRPCRRARRPWRRGRPAAPRCPGCRTRTGWRRWRRRPRPTPRGRPRSSPSSVVTVRPRTRRTGVTHATRGWPSTSTVQHPHWPCGLHPSFAERRPELLPQHLEERGALVGHLDRPPVHGQADRRALGGHPARIGTGGRAVRRRRWRRSARRGRPRTGAPATRPGSIRCTPRAAPSTARGARRSCRTRRRRAARRCSRPG